ncbi:MAG: hypothetical protein AAGL98_12985, partial [Planctomycetota bacterium]
MFIQLFNGRRPRIPVRSLIEPWAIVAVLVLSALTPGCSYPNRGQPLERLGANLGVMPRGAAFDSPK